MTKSEDANAQALPALLRAARADVNGLRNTLLEELSSRNLQNSPISTAQLLLYVREYGAALLKLTSLESQIDHDSTAICGIVRGNSVNLDDARREVIDRIARFRERSGD
jgi:hypothetical protein